MYFEYENNEEATAIETVSLWMRVKEWFQKLLK